MCRLNPRVDFVFKKLFGSEEHADLLISLINSIVSAQDQVVRIEIKNPYNEKSFARDKFSVLDIKAQDEKGRWYNIEMQITDQEYYDKRSLYYWSRLYTSQLQEGMNYDKLAKTIGINILNFNCLPDKKYHNRFRLLNVDTGVEFIDDMEIHVIELKKYEGDIESVKTALDRWIVFLTRAHEFSRSKIPPTLAEVTSIARAIEILDTMGLSTDERAVYDGRLKWLRDEEMAIQTAHMRGKAEGLAAGKAEGLAEGKAEGLAEGKAEGLAEGKAEGLAEGEEMGRAKGIVEGEAKGRAEALADALKRLLAAGISEEQAKKMLGLE
jgi:predicted transposase/invertase (TIGR01784 family)